MKKIRTLLLALAALGTLLVPIAVPATVLADDAIQSGLCAGTNLATDTSNCDQNNGSTDKINSIIKIVINLFSILVGVVAVIMLIVGGLKYIISSGDSGNVQSAKNTIIYAIVGLVIVALAQFIVRFVLTKVTAP